MSRILEGKRIFLIEDDVLELKLLSASLRKEGALVEQNIFGSNIVTSIVENLPIDLIVLDLMLRGGINGYDIYDEIRRKSKLALVPVVAVTSLDPKTEIPKARAKGFAGFIHKPINLPGFPQELANIINRKTVWVKD